MSRDWLTLADGETVAWEGSPILTTSLPGVGVGIALVVAGAWLAVVGPAGLAATLGGAALAAAGVAAAVGAYLAVVNTEYVVSDRALYAKSGIVGVRVTEAALSRVQNSAFSQDALGAAFGYGTVTFEIAGGNDVRFRRIDDPKGVRRTVDRATGDEIPGSLDQWRAVLAETRALRRAVESRPR
ncbi:PH domain-containing protein [Halosegnis marinus]|uniref:PH domain-containing protein n=1 Tax=Halosegnis marinus TaxID=3034023 RepID=A0ABD5ZRM0_9EURY|nr:PH domain-containing protein [Halosegnis sp. DT85]